MFTDISGMKPNLLLIHFFRFLANVIVVRVPSAQRHVLPATATTQGVQQAPGTLGFWT